MTNETYLVVSYLTAALVGVVLALLTASELARPLREALAGLTKPLVSVLRRALPVWLVLAVLLGFLSVSYFDCGHKTYQQIVADRDHLAATTRRHGSEMARYLAAALMLYGLALAAALSAKARMGRAGKGDQRES